MFVLLYVIYVLTFYFAIGGVALENGPSTGDILTKLTIAECAEIKFIQIPQVLVNVAVNSGADITKFEKILAEEENVLVGAPDTIVHPCKEHLEKQMADNSINGIEKGLIDRLIAVQQLEGAATSLKVALDIQKTNQGV